MAVSLLSVAKVKAAQPGDKLSDGGGLRLDVDPAGNRKWTLRFKSPVTGKERYAGLGSADVVTLAQARQLAQDARELIGRGIDPIDKKRDQRDAQRVDAARSTTFEQYARSYIIEHEPSWKNPKHRQQWTNSLQTYAFPVIGAKALPDVNETDVLAILRPIWIAKPETANRVRGRIETLLDAAMAEGKRPKGFNPAVWKGHLKALLPSKAKVHKVEHHPALPYALLPEFMRSLVADTSDAALLLRFTILTAARYNESAFATPGEVDGDIWEIPAVRMKAERLHAVPLSAEALKVLQGAKARYSGEHFIFPGQGRNRPISDTTLRNVIGRHTKEDATTHGFRSTFRDWAGDETNFPREVIEAAIAHAVGDETERAYRRSTAFVKRRALMDAWATFCTP
jgi:integrase